MSRLFGTDGVRGLANVPPMDSDTVLRLGRSAARVLRRSEGRHRILIGKDTRISGYMLETALASGVCSMGVDVLLVGPLPTPGVAYLTRSMRADAGVMISASHNSYEDNGIKFFGADGFKLADETENEIERLMEPGHLDELRASPELIGKAQRIEDAIGRYTVFLKSVVERDVSLSGLTLVVDSANGAAYRVAPLVFQELGAEIVTLGDKPDGKNINLRCGSLHPELMVESVKRIAQGISAAGGSQLVCGIAFDGDADRVLLCDENGEIFDGDEILAMLAKDFHTRGVLKGGGVVGTTMTNLGLEVWLRNQGLSVVRSDVGDRYVLQEMQARGLNLGGEQSGHIISLDHNTTGDGLLTALLVLSTMKRDKKPLSAYKNAFQRYPQILKSLRVARKPPLEEQPEIQAALGRAEGVLKGQGRVVLRYSGTEAKIRIMVECERQDMCSAVAKELETVVGSALG